jgi:uncharacterized Zn finger protein (UPF0148 family)
MAFLTTCNNRGCNHSVAAELELETGKVFCPDCGKEISNLTIFTKNQIKNAKQIKKPKKEAFSTICPACKHDALPALNKTNQLVCVKCQAQLINIPIPFQPLIREAIKNKMLEEKEDNK